MRAGAGCARSPVSDGRAALRRVPTSGPPVRKTFKSILAEYGTTALVVYLVIFTVVLLGFWLGIRLGWQPESVVGNVGTFTAAYLATKVTQPLRIAATLVLTPITAKLWVRATGRRPGAAETAASAEPAPPASPPSARR